MKYTYPLLILLHLSGCATPLPMPVIEKLTTCENPMSVVRKRLVRDGYAITAGGDDYFNTDIRRPSFDPNGFVSRAFYVEKINSSSTKLIIKTDLDSDGRIDWQTPDGVTDKNQDQFIEINNFLCR